MVFLIDLGRPISRGCNLKAKNLNSLITWCTFDHYAAALMTGLEFSICYSGFFFLSPFKPKEDIETKSWDQKHKGLFAIKGS